MLIIALTICSENTPLLEEFVNKHQASHKTKLNYVHRPPSRRYSVYLLVRSLYEILGHIKRMCRFEHQSHLNLTLYFCETCPRFKHSKQQPSFLTISFRLTLIYMWIHNYAYRDSTYKNTLWFLLILRKKR